MKLPARFQHIVFGFLLSGLMSFLVSGIATLKAVGVSGAFLMQWMSAWLPSWAVAFPAVLVVAPVVRRLTSKLVEAPRDLPGVAKRPS